LLRVRSLTPPFHLFTSKKKPCLVRGFFCACKTFYFLCVIPSPRARQVSQLPNNFSLIPF
jgi:hypothetical protein